MSERAIDKVTNETSIKCPKCGKEATSQPEWVTSYFDPKFVCQSKRPKCGYEGRLFWKRKK